MDNERVLIIGPGGLFRKSTLISGTHLEEFKVIIFHPSTVIEEWRSAPGQQRAIKIIGVVSECIDWTEFLET